MQHILLLHLFFHLSFSQPTDLFFGPWVETFPNSIATWSTPTLNGNLIYHGGFDTNTPGAAGELRRTFTPHGTGSCELRLYAYFGCDIEFMDLINIEFGSTLISLPG